MPVAAKLSNLSNHSNSSSNFSIASGSSTSSRYPSRLDLFIFRLRRAKIQRAERHLNRADAIAAHFARMDLVEVHNLLIRQRCALEALFSRMERVMGYIAAYLADGDCWSHSAKVPFLKGVSADRRIMDLVCAEDVLKDLKRHLIRATKRDRLMGFLLDHLCDQQGLDWAMDLYPATSPGYKPWFNNIKVAIDDCPEDKNIEDDLAAAIERIKELEARYPAPTWWRRVIT